MFKLKLCLLCCCLSDEYKKVNSNYVQESIIYLLLLGVMRFLVLLLFSLCGWWLPWSISVVRWSLFDRLAGWIRA